MGTCVGLFCGKRSVADSELVHTSTALYSDLPGETNLRVPPQWWMDFDGFSQSLRSLGGDRVGGALESMHLNKSESKRKTFKHAETCINLQITYLTCM